MNSEPEQKEFVDNFVENPDLVLPNEIRRYINEVRKLAAPDIFMGRQDLHPDLNYEKVVLAEGLKEKIRKIQEILNHSALDQLIKEGKLTVALIKPNIQVGRVPGTDASISDEILAEINKHEHLKVVFSMPTIFSEEDFEIFYSDNKKQFSKTEDPDSDDKTIWDRLRSFMLEGATNMVLLYSEDGSAVNHWRELIGPTDPTKDTEKKTIRGKFAWDIRNTIVHGSDKKESVEKEIQWMKKKTDNMLKPPEINDDDILDEKQLRNLGILANNETFVSIYEFLPPKEPIKNRVASAKFGAYVLTYIKEGHVEHERFTVKIFNQDKVKNKKIVTKEERAKNEVKRMEICKVLLTKFSNIPLYVPKVYATDTTEAGDPRIVREFAIDQTKILTQTLTLACSHPERKLEMIEPLIKIAAFLDINGVPSKLLPNSFFFNGQTFSYTGEDYIQFENCDPKKPVETGIGDLLTLLGKDDANLNMGIRKKYAEFIDELKKQTSEL